MTARPPLALAPAATALDSARFSMAAAFTGPCAVQNFELVMHGPLHGLAGICGGSGFHVFIQPLQTKVIENVVHVPSLPCAMLF